MIEAKGKNGYFKVATFRATILGHLDTVVVEVRSKRMGDSAPLVIIGSPAEIVAMFQTMIESINRQVAERNVEVKPT